MKYGLLAIGIVLSVVIYLGLIVPAYERATTAALSDDARLAIDVRCGTERSHKADACRDTFKKLFLAGSLDPDKTLRAYCESVKTARWGGSRPPPPKLCVERYGGWVEG